MIRTLNDNSRELRPPPAVIKCFGLRSGCCCSPTGFNPRWDCTFNFTVHVPDLALVRFKVEDHDYASNNDFLGQYTLPFTSLRTGVCPRWMKRGCRSGIQLLSCVFTFSGYRHVRLMKMDGSSLSPSSLFIYVKAAPSGSPS